VNPNAATIATSAYGRFGTETVTTQPMITNAQRGTQNAVASAHYNTSTRGSYAQPARTYSAPNANYVPVSRNAPAAVQSGEAGSNRADHKPNH
jgi:hypothetical protein